MADHTQHQSLPVDVRRHPRFQPWVLLIGTASVIPLLVTGDTPTWLWVFGAGCLALSAAAWAQGARRQFTATARDRTAMLGALAGAIGIAALLGTVAAADPSLVLLLACAAVASIAATPSRLVRHTFEASILAMLATSMVAAGWSILDIVIPVVLVACVAVLSEAFVTEFGRLTQEELRARDDAARRASLVDAVRNLADEPRAVAIRRVVDSLLELGFDASAVLLEQGMQLTVVEVGGGTAGGGTEAPSDGWARSVLEQGHGAKAGAATVQVGSAIRSDGTALGVLVGVRAGAGPATPADREIVAVLADHLGVALTTEHHVSRQHELRRRMQRLDRLRSSFVAAVSTELRNPLEFIRSAGEQLSRGARDMDAATRRQLLRQLRQETDVLHRTVDALLDFSRFQANRSLTEPVETELGPLLESVTVPLGGSVRYLDVDVDPGTLVRVEPELIRHALQLVAIATNREGPIDLAVKRLGTNVRVTILKRDGNGSGEQATVPRRASGADQDPPPLVRALVAQLLVAGGASLAHGAPAAAVLPARFASARSEPGDDEVVTPGAGTTASEQGREV